jgi:hypothetical protein
LMKLQIHAFRKNVVKNLYNPSIKIYCKIEFNLKEKLG